MISGSICVNLSFFKCEPFGTIRHFDGSNMTRHPPLRTQDPGDQKGRLDKFGQREVGPPCLGITWWWDGHTLCIYIYIMYVYYIYMCVCIIFCWLSSIMFTRRVKAVQVPRSWKDFQFGCLGCLGMGGCCCALLKPDSFFFHEGNEVAWKLSGGNMYVRTYKSFLLRSYGAPSWQICCSESSPCPMPLKMRP